VPSRRSGLSRTAATRTFCTRSPPGATCTNPNQGLSSASGFAFDVSDVVSAGEDAVTTNCAPGLAGSATRRCVWSGPNSQFGTWATPISNCERASSNPGAGSVVQASGY